jgi:four helix bundle protein
MLENSRAPDLAPLRHVAGVHRFEDLIAWQLACQLRRKCEPLLDRTRQARDFKLHEQIRDAARSGPRNIAEGFGRYKHRDFARFVRNAKASELELLDAFREAFNEGYLTARERHELEHAALKAVKVATSLIRYLESTPDGQFD